MGGRPATWGNKTDGQNDDCPPSRHERDQRRPAPARPDDGPPHGPNGDAAAEREMPALTPDQGSLAELEKTRSLLRMPKGTGGWAKRNAAEERPRQGWPRS